MRKQITIALLCMAAPTSALSQTYDPPKQVQIRPITAQREAEAERLRQEQMRLENERLRQEIQLREREAQRREQERVQLQREATERERAQVAALREQEKETNQTAGPDIYEQLRTIGQLRDNGILTEEEFQGLKEKILDEHRPAPAIDLNQ